MPVRIRILKGAQVLVAIATTLAVGAGFLWPGAMALFVLPIVLLYVIWAVRAAFDRRLSVWLSFATTLAVALFIGTIAFWSVLDLSADREEFSSADTPVAVDAAGSMVELSAEVLPEWRQAQARIYEKNRLYRRVHAGMFTLISLAAWVVVILSVLEWRWLSGRTFNSGFE